MTIGWILIVCESEVWEACLLGLSVDYNVLWPLLYIPSKVSFSQPGVTFPAFSRSNSASCSHSDSFCTSQLDVSLLYSVSSLLLKRLLGSLFAYYVIWGLDILEYIFWLCLGIFIDVDGEALWICDRCLLLGMAVEGKWLGSHFRWVTCNIFILETREVRFFIHLCRIYCCIPIRYRYFTLWTFL